MAKRAFDFIVATLGLLVLLPVLAGIALWVKLDSPGPAIFRQERVGRGGRVFRILKFRSMVVDAPKRGGVLTVGRDSRITRAGQFLRRFKLDELPQLMNVIKGDMSLVGPRPEVPKYVELYPDDAKTEILAVRPGITDPASIEFISESEVLGRVGDPEQVYRDVVLPRKIRIYRDYVSARSFSGDIVLIFRTVLAALRS